VGSLYLVPFANMVYPVTPTLSVEAAPKEKDLLVVVVVPIGRQTTWCQLVAGIPPPLSVTFAVYLPAETICVPASTSVTVRHRWYSWVSVGSH